MTKKSTRVGVKWSLKSKKLKRNLHIKLKHFAKKWTNLENQQKLKSKLKKKEDRQALLKARYCPRVAAVSRMQKNSEKNSWPGPLTDDFEI